MMVVVNGRRWELPEGSSVADVIERFGAPGSGVAVALDGAMVPRTLWPSALLHEGALVEVLTAVQGG